MVVKKIGRQRGVIGQLVAIALIAAAGLAYWMATRPGYQPDKGRLNYHPLKYDNTAAATRVATEATTAAIPFTFEEARGFTVAADGTVYVVGDTGLVGIGNSGATTTAFEMEAEPQAVALGPDGLLYVCLKSHVAVYTTNGVCLATWASPGGQAYLRCIDVNEAHAFVSDYGNRMVYRYALDGKLKGRIGQKDTEIGERGFIVPSPYFELAIADNQTLWVVDPGRHKVINYDFDGTRISSWEQAGMQVEGFCGCCNPTHFALLPGGGFLTSEKGIARVKVYDPHGSLVGVVAGPGDFEPHTRGLDLAVDTKGRYMVLDPMRQRIRIFTPVQQGNPAS